MMDGACSLTMGSSVGVSVNDSISISITAIMSNQLLLNFSSI